MLKNPAREVAASRGVEAICVKPIIAALACSPGLTSIMCVGPRNTAKPNSTRIAAFKLRSYALLYLTWSGHATPKGFREL